MKAHGHRTNKIGGFFDVSQSGLGGRLFVGRGERGDITIRKEKKKELGLNIRR